MKTWGSLARHAAVVAVSIGSLLTVGCANEADTAEPVAAEGEIGTTQQAITNCETCEPAPTYTYSYQTTTSNIAAAQVCAGASTPENLQKRASAVFDYLIGKSTLPTSLYPCYGSGTLNYTKLDYIKTALSYNVETADIRNCFHTTNNNCGVTNVRAARHVLTYSGSSASVVDALKTLEANVNACWNGAGTWIHPAKPNVAINWEGPESNNFGEDCRYKEAYVSTTKKVRSDGLVVSTTYKIGCYRTDPEPATLTSNLSLSANGNYASAVNSNTGLSTPWAYSYQSTWKYDPSGPPAGAPCVAPQPSTTTWYTNWYVNNFMQVSGSYRRCLNAQ